MQRVQVGVLPQVQILTLYFDNELNYTSLQSITCGPLNITLEDSNGTQTLIPLLPLSTGDTKADIEQELNSLEAVQSVGRIVARLKPKPTVGEVDIVFVFATNPGIDPTTIPTLKLNSINLTLPCMENNTDSDISVISTSLSTVQTYTNLGHFSLGFDGSYTPYIPIDSPSQLVEQELMDLFSWECSVHLQGRRVVFYESYDDNSEKDEEMPAAYCGRYSEHSPETIALEEDLELHHSTGNRYVSWS